MRSRSSQSTLPATDPDEPSHGRVGRSAAAKQFDPTAVRLAVIAHVRHKYTKYDNLLAQYDDRQLARSEVRGQIEDLLHPWEGGE